jgi:16S rRNA (guanine527-N7)-methyltransferase
MTTPQESLDDPAGSIEPIDDNLTSALARHSVELPAEQAELLDRYRGLLWQWNERLNLTRHTTYEKFVGRDVIDSRQLAEYLEPGDRILDVGSGGGVPGLLLAILRPDVEVTVSEATGKKARVLDEIVAELRLPVRVYHGRAEQAVAEGGLFEAVTVRAVASLDKLLTWFAPHWDSIGRLLVIKGPAWVEERREARRRHLLDGLELRRAAQWQIPGNDHPSVLLQIRVPPGGASAPRRQGQQSRQGRR